MKKQLIKIAILGIILFAGRNAESAVNETIDMERIVVTTSRTQEDSLRATRHTTVLTYEDIDRVNASSVTDVLRTVPGLCIRDYSGTGKSVNVDMAGFGETGPSNMLVLIDGRRVNAIDLSNTDWSQISPDQIEKIEIVRGAGSVLYGDNATAGVVNIITKKGTGRPMLRLEQMGGSYMTSGTSLETSGSNSHLSYRLNAEMFDTKGYRENSDLSRRDFGFNIGRNLTDALKLDVTAGWHTDRYRLAGALKENELIAYGRRATVKPNDLADSFDTFADLGFTWDGQEQGVLETRFTGRLREVDSTYISSSWRNENHIVTLGATPKYTLKTDLNGHLNTLILGADIYRTEDDILDGGLTGANDKIEITKDSQGFYVQDRFEATERLTLKGGVRREDAHYDFNQIAQVQERAKSRLTDEVYEAGLSCVYAENSSVYLDAATSFRHPLVDEFFTSNTYGFGGLNATLSTQTGRNIEMGVRHAWSPVLKTGLGYFRHDIQNEIYYDPLTFVNANYDRTLHQGFIFDGSWEPDKIWSFFGHYAYTQARFGKGSYEDFRIPGVPEHKASAGLEVKPWSTLRLGLVMTYVGRMYYISDPTNAQPKINDYTTLDAHAAYTVKNLEIFLNLNNIFDAEYSEYGIYSSFSSTRSTYPAPGRHVTAGCRYKF